MKDDAANLYDKIEHLLRKETCCDAHVEKLKLINTAILKATRLVELEPKSADAYHLLALCWYHHPDKSPHRSNEIRRNLNHALSIDPQHQFANQYLGYINYDEGFYKEALDCFERTDSGFFESIDQIWRSLKARELKVVCKLHLDLESFGIEELNSFIAAYKAQFQRESSNTAWPSELIYCIEWLYANGLPVDNPIIDSAFRFFDEIDFLNVVKKLQFVEAWRKSH